MINETVFLGECPIIRPEGIYYGGRRVIALDPTLGVSAPPVVTWVTWYNAASASDQSKFDDDSAVLDDTSTTSDQKANYITVFGGSASEKAALTNYVATGGRRALFATPPKDYGPNPIAVIKPAGPIEKTPDGSTLHPGTYTYRDVSGNSGGAFEQWVQANGKTVKRTVAQTQAAALPGGAAYYTDNVLVVYQDTLWPASLMGLPTWLPPGTDPIKYWGKVLPPAGPDWGAIIPDPKTIHWLGIAAVVAVAVVGGALVVYYVPRRSPAPQLNRA
jgi:hypothetical protein